MQTKSTDIELIDEILRGNQSAYAELVKRHQRFVFTLALRFSKSREDAEEIAQDSFIKAYRSLHTFQRTSRFSTWMYSIVYTTSMTFLRKKKLETSSIEDDETYFQLENHESDFNANTAELKSRSAYINKAITMLLPDDAAIITLFYQSEQSIEEISRAMNMEANTVKVKLHRARHRLKEKLEHLLKHEVKELL
ncbi:RNA polymerase sigma factor [Rubrolithibacter danxiaensis]|uniref:RNA polymerase sigma factor n=1 Tax=Rubrolithibacter danxiaensis TaxID=3390805 RepID=UPI003BF8188C